MTPDWDVQLFRWNSGVRQRVWIPSDPFSPITGAEFSLSEKGGFTEGKIDLEIPWELLGLTGTEEADLYIAGVCLYRGAVQLPDVKLELPEAKTLNLYGPAAALGRVQIQTRQAYATYVDWNVIVRDLVTDNLITPGRNSATVAANLVLDLQPIGVTLNQFDASGKYFGDALQQLVDMSPGSAVWGFDLLANADGTYSTRFYLRPRATTVKYTWVVGDRIESISSPIDTTQICNRARIKGGPAFNPNLSVNGSFEYPLPPSEYVANLLGDGLFEDSLEYKSTAWTLVADASIKSISDTGDGLPGAYDGSNYASMDQAGEAVTQTIPIDPTRPMQAWCWVRRGNDTIPATFDFTVEGQNAAGTTLLTYSFLNHDPATDAIAGGKTEQDYWQYLLTCDWTAQPTITKVKYTILSHSGTNHNDGVLADNTALIYTDQPGQSGWSYSLTNCPAPSVNWVFRQSLADPTVPQQGLTCIRIAANPGSGGYVEVANTATGRASIPKWRKFTLGFWAKAPAGQAFSIVPGIRLVNSDGTLAATVIAPTIAGPMDGSWQPVVVSFGSDASEVDGEIFFRIMNSAPTYLDAVMLVPGNMPDEFSTLGNWWPSDRYEIVVDAGGSLMAGAGISAEAAASASVYGIREQDVSNEQVLDIHAATALALGYLETWATPRRRNSVKLAHWTTAIGFDGKSQICNIPNPPPALCNNRVEWKISNTGTNVSIELDDQRPELAALLKYLANTPPPAIAPAGAGGSGGTSPYNSGAPVGTGAAVDVKVVHKTGAETITGPKTFESGDVATPAVVLEGIPSQTAPLLQVLDSGGLPLSGFELDPDGWGYSGGRRLIPGGMKQACRAATTANITLSGAQTIDGVSVVSGDRVLVKNQTTASANGIYAAAAGAWSRAADAGFSADVTEATAVFVAEGTTNAGTLWYLSTAAPIVLGTTALTFTQLTGGGGGGGSTWHQQAGVPSAGLGSDGDYDLNDTTGDVYFKVAGSWGSPIWSPDGRYLKIASNLSDLGSAGTARTNLGLGTAAVHDIPAVGNASSSQVVFGTDTRLADSRAPSGAAGGDLTGSFPSPTLAAIGSAAGPVGDGTHVSSVTIDAKGRVTALTSTAITGAPPTGSAGGDLTGTYPNPTLAAAGPGITSAGDATHSSALTIDAKGRVTALAAVTITGTAPGGAAGGDLTGTYPNPTLAAIGSASGPTGDAGHIPAVTIDAKGRVTALTSAAVQRVLPMYLCVGFTPTTTGADSAEVGVPYAADGTTTVTWTVRRMDVIVRVAGGAPAVTIEKYTGTGAFVGTTVGTVTLSGGANVGSITGGFGTTTLVSGDRLRMNIGALGTATEWTVWLQLGT
jgi:hypothetical protein